MDEFSVPRETMPEKPEWGAMKKTFSSTAGLHVHAPTHIWTPTCSYTTHIYTQTCTYMGELLPLPEK